MRAADEEEPGACGQVSGPFSLASSKLDSWEKSSNAHTQCTHPTTVCRKAQVGSQREERQCFPSGQGLPTYCKDSKVFQNRVLVVEE